VVSPRTAKREDQIAYRHSLALTMLPSIQTGYDLCGTDEENSYKPSKKLEVADRNPRPSPATLKLGALTLQAACLPAPSAGWVL